MPPSWGNDHARAGDSFSAHAARCQQAVKTISRYQIVDSNLPSLNSVVEVCLEAADDLISEMK